MDHFWACLGRNSQHVAALYELSKNLRNKEQAQSLLEKTRAFDLTALGRRESSLYHFAIANCFHQLSYFKEASVHLAEANAVKLEYCPSDASSLIARIHSRLAQGSLVHGLPPASMAGRGRIFIVGLPRSGSTLLESVLGRNPDAVCLGESFALQRALELVNQEEGFDDLDSAYQVCCGADRAVHSYTLDKQLYNFEISGLIAEHLPQAKILHCHRNPMDQLLSMFRANLYAGNNFTSDLVGAAHVLVAQEKAILVYRSQWPEQIMCFNYDAFVCQPEMTLRPLLCWLGWQWSDCCLRPELSTHAVVTASVVEVRQPIHRGSLGSWKHYAELLEPARQIILASGLFNAYPDLNG